MAEGIGGAQSTHLQWLTRLPWRGHPAVGYLAAVVFSLLALLLRFKLDSSLPPGFPFVSFFPAVIATAFLFGTGPAILSAVLCGLFSRYLFIAPVHSFSLGHGAGWAMALYAFVVGVDIVLVELMQRAFRRLEREREVSRQLADHREILFRELQHRVGNNIQMVGALLSLQKRHLEDPHGRAALDEAARRLHLIGRVQRQLYGMPEDHRGLGIFLSEITRDIVDSAGRSDIAQVVEGGEELWLHPDDAIPVALIVAEAIANALEHGFAERTGGNIRLTITQTDEDLAISIENDGHSLPDGFDHSGLGSLGLRLAGNLAAGRQGVFRLEPGGLGTVARIVLPRRPMD